MVNQKEPGNFKRLGVKIGGIAGVIAILSLIVTVAQLQQGAKGQEQDEIGQATVLAMDQAQLEAFEQMVTLQSRLVEGSESDAVETSIAAQIEDLKTTLEPGDSGDNVESIPSSPVPIKTPTPTDTVAPTNTPTPTNTPILTIISSFDSNNTNGWTINLGTITNPGLSGNTGGENDGHIRTNSPGDNKTSYYIAPPAFHRDWREFSILQVDLWSSGGNYYSEGTTVIGDIYIANGELSAYRLLPSRPPETWETFTIPLEDDGLWVFGVGTMSLDDVLARVTNFMIRAEYGEGDDHSGLDNVTLIR